MKAIHIKYYIYQRRSLTVTINIIFYSINNGNVSLFYNDTNDIQTKHTTNRGKKL